MSKRFFGIINTPKTATNDETKFFGAQNTPVFDVPSDPMFNFQASSEEQLTATKLTSGSKESNDSEGIHSRRNSVSDSEQYEESLAPLKLADPLEHRGKRRHHSGGSHLSSEVSPQQPIVATVELKSSFRQDSYEQFSQPFSAANGCIENTDSVSAASDLASTIDNDTSSTVTTHIFDKDDKMSHLFDDQDDDGTSVDFDNCIDNDLDVIPEKSVADGAPVRKKTRGRVKINIELIKDKERRSTTFSKRKNGILKKAKELAVLTGAQVMLLIASETGHVYSYATEKLRPIIQGSEGEQLVLSCLKRPQDSEKSGSSRQIKMEVIPCVSSSDNPNNANTGFTKSRVEHYTQPKNNRKRKLEELREAREDANKSVPLINGHFNSPSVHNSRSPDLRQQNYINFDQNSSQGPLISNNRAQLSQHGLLIQANNLGKASGPFTTAYANSSAPSLTSAPSIVSNHSSIVQHVLRQSDAQGHQSDQHQSSSIPQVFIRGSLLQGSPSHHQSSMGITSQRVPSSVATTQYYVASSNNHVLPNAHNQNNLLNLSSLPVVHSASSSGTVLEIPRIKQEFSSSQLMNYTNSVDGTTSPAGSLISLRPVQLEQISVAASLVNNSHPLASAVAFPAQLQVVGGSAASPSTAPPRIRSVPPSVSNSNPPETCLSPSRT